jgi:hypothetical protein
MTADGTVWTHTCSMWKVMFLAEHIKVTRIHLAANVRAAEQMLLHICFMHQVPFLAYSLGAQIYPYRNI